MELNSRAVLIFVPVFSGKGNLKPFLSDFILDQPLSGNATSQAPQTPGLLQQAFVLKFMGLQVN